LRLSGGNGLAVRARQVIPVDQGVQYVGDRVEIADESPEVRISDNGWVLHDLLREIDAPAERGDERPPRREKGLPAQEAHAGRTASISSVTTPGLRRC